MYLQGVVWMKLNFGKIFVYIVFGVIVIFSFNTKVYAAYTNWPGFNNNSISTIKSKYPEYDLCVYNTNRVLTSNSDFSESSEQYSNSSFIFAYNSSNSELKFVNSNMDLKSVSGSYIWDDSGLNQSIRFGSDLKDYLVDNDTLSCKELYFIGTAGDNVFSRGGSLDIYSESSFNNNYHFNEEDWRLEELKKTTVAGNYYASETRKCDDYLSQLKPIAEKYYTEQKEPLDKLQELKNAEFNPGDFVIAMGYLDSFKALLEQTISDLDALQLTNVADGNGFYVGNCGGTQSLESEYTKLKSSLVYGNKLINDWNTTLALKLDAADPTGTNEAYAQDRLAAQAVQESLDALNVKLENYLAKINTGEEITDESCEGLLGEDLLNDISLVFTWIRIAVPILVIILGSTDFARAVLADDQQELKKATSRFTKRCIIAVAIFFVPSIIMYLLSFIDKIADVSCDIRLW